MTNHAFSSSSFTWYLKSIFYSKYLRINNLRAFLYLKHFFPVFSFRNPNGENIPLWPSYEINSKQYIIFDIPIKTAENLKSEATALLSRILETGRRHSTRDEL